MAKRTTIRPRNHWWAVYHDGAKRKFIGIVYNARDAETAIKRAIEDFDVPPNERGKPPEPLRGCRRLMKTGGRREAPPKGAVE